MGTMGAGLYDDDVASDIKRSVDLVAKVPRGGDGLLAVLESIHGSADPDAEDGALFWLVVADRFERKGIHSARVLANALQVIDRGVDLAACRDRGADDRFLAARGRTLQELAARLRNPRPERSRRAASTPPPQVLSVGEVFAFPTMAGRAWHPYRLASAGPFAPDGWGALVVLAAGRAFDWIPWLALASLTVEPTRRPTLAEALDAGLIAHPQTHGAGRFIPKPAHAKGLGLELLGRVELDPLRVEPQLSTWSIAQAVEVDWTLCYAAFSTQVVGRGASAGPALNSLCGRAG